MHSQMGRVTAVEETLELQMLHRTPQGTRRLETPRPTKSATTHPWRRMPAQLALFDRRDSLGLGPAAASHVQGWRWRNCPRLGKWERTITAGDVPAIEVETLSADRRGGELAMLMLRLSRGLNFADFANRTDRDARTFAPIIDRLLRHGLLTQVRSPFALPIAVWRSQTRLQPSFSPPPPDSKTSLLSVNPAGLTVDETNGSRVQGVRVQASGKSETREASLRVSLFLNPEP